MVLILPTEVVANLLFKFRYEEERYLRGKCISIFTILVEFVRGGFSSQGIQIIFLQSERVSNARGGNRDVPYPFVMFMASEVTTQPLHRKYSHATYESRPQIIYHYLPYLLHALHNRQRQTDPLLLLQLLISFSFSLYSVSS
jgi:hypothetical protein